jgi:hypothetical protein
MSLDNLQKNVDRRVAALPRTVPIGGTPSHTRIRVKKFEVRPILTNGGS